MIQVGQMFLGRLVIAITATEIILNCGPKKDIVIRYKMK